MRETHGKFREMTGMHFTMREIFKPSNLLLQAGLCVVGIGLFVQIGPFDTYYDMPLGQQILYWGAIMIVNWSMSAVAFQAAAMWASGNKKPLAPVVLLVAGAVSFPATLAVYIANVVFRPNIVEIVPVLSLFGSVLVITICIAISRRQLAAEPQPAPSAETGAVGTLLLRSLPPELRGALIRLLMNDHYIEVDTIKGAALVLLRLADALEELGDADGLQVHRSQWVARTAVEGVRRDGSRMFLSLCTGQEIPVSRTYRAAVRDAGMI
jgi:DNA-binding LytR/AlgR family response regulator